jgi:hypothetical protein
MNKAILKKFHHNKKRNYTEMLSTSSTNYPIDLTSSQNKKLKIKSTKFSDVKIFSPQDEIIEKSNTCINQNINQKINVKNKDSLNLSIKPRSMTCTKLLSKSSSQISNKNKIYTSQRNIILNSKSSNNTEFKIEENLNRKKKV